MTTLEYIYNDFHEELVSYEKDHGKLIKYIVNVPENLSADRLFVRNRIFSITNLLTFMIMPRCETLAAELADFCLMRRCGEVSKSAFSQRRRNLSEKILPDLNNFLTSRYYDTNLPRKWKGRYLIAIDGTCVTMPRGKRFEKLFGCVKNSQSDIPRPTARAVFIVDALNHIVLSSALVDYSTDEATVAWSLISKLPRDFLDQCVFLFDRLYPSSWFFTQLQNNSIQFVMRCRTYFNSEIDAFFNSAETHRDVKLDVSAVAWRNKTEKRYERMNIKQSDQRPLYVHLTKSRLPSGETEVIASNVFGMEMSARQAYLLYGQRWGVETVIDEEKNQAQIEMFSGFSKQCILQDFYAKILSHNLCQMAANAADKKANSKYRKHRKGTKDSHNSIYRVHVNMNLALYEFRHHCIKLFCEISVREIQKFINSISENFSAVIPGRHIPRLHIAYKLNGKYVTYTNYGRAI